LFGTTVALIQPNDLITHAFREDVMKKLLLSLMVLATLASCGKDNKVSSGSSTDLLNVSNPLVTNNPYAQELVTRINNPAAGFGGGLVLTSSGSSNQTCGTKWGFINYCYGSSGSANYAVTAGMTWNQLVAQRPNLAYYFVYSQPVVHSSINIATKQAQLIQLLNSASNIQVSGTLYYITVSGAYYVIDTRYPIQANPSAIQTTQYTDYLTGAY
jgi:hypothetical protein